MKGAQPTVGKSRIFSIGRRTGQQSICPVSTLPLSPRRLCVPPHRFCVSSVLYVLTLHSPYIEQNRATRAVKSSIGTGSREAREPERRPCDFMVTPTS